MQRIILSCHSRDRGAILRVYASAPNTSIPRARSAFLSTGERGGGGGDGGRRDVNRIGIGSTSANRGGVAPNAWHERAERDDRRRGIDRHGAARRGGSIQVTPSTSAEDCRFDVNRRRFSDAVDRVDLKAPAVYRRRVTARRDATRRNNISRRSALGSR